MTELQLLLRGWNSAGIFVPVSSITLLEDSFQGRGHGLYFI